MKILGKNPRMILECALLISNLISTLPSTLLSEKKLIDMSNLKMFPSILEKKIIVFAKFLSKVFGVRPNTVYELHIIHGYLIRNKNQCNAFS